MMVASNFLVKILSTPPWRVRLRSCVWDPYPKLTLSEKHEPILISLRMFPIEKRLPNFIKKYNKLTLGPQKYKRHIKTVLVAPKFFCIKSPIVQTNFSLYSIGVNLYDLFDTYL